MKAYLPVHMKNYSKNRHWWLKLMHKAYELHLPSNTISRSVFQIFIKWDGEFCFFFYFLIFLIVCRLGNLFIVDCTMFLSIFFFPQIWGECEVKDRFVENEMSTFFYLYKKRMHNVHICSSFCQFWFIFSTLFPPADGTLSMNVWLHTIIYIYIVAKQNLWKDQWNT